MQSITQPLIVWRGFWTSRAEQLGNSFVIFQKDCVSLAFIFLDPRGLAIVVLVTILSYLVKMPHVPAPSARLAPNWGMFALELAAAVHPRRFLSSPAAEQRDIGHGRPVLVVPGFLASDMSTRPLRLGLRHAGFRAHGWKRGRNLGLTDSNIFEIIDARVRHIARGEPVSLVGWSLGGLIAREYAKRAPDSISRVVTLGSPIAGDPRQNNNVWRLYEWIAGHPVDAPPVPCTLDEKPPVDTVAIWSRKDGIVAAHSACAIGCADRSIEVECSHMGMVFEPAAIRAVVSALS